METYLKGRLLGCTWPWLYYAGTWSAGTMNQPDHVSNVRISSHDQYSGYEEGVGVGFNEGIRVLGELQKFP